MTWFLKQKIVLMVFCLMMIPFSLNAQASNSSSINVKLIVSGCNNNSICELDQEEDILNCPLDCGIVPPDTEPSPEDDDSGRSRSGSKIPLPEMFIDFEIQDIEYPNPKSIKITVTEKNISLFWQNPVRSDFDFVRIMKNTEYSNNPYDGIIVYEGKQEYFKDNIASFDKNYFYNFFAKYKDGYFSKGTTLFVNSKTPSVFEGIKSDIKNTTDIKIPENDPFEQIFFTPKLNIYDFSFFQDGKKMIWNKRVLQADSDGQILVQLPKRDFFGPIYDIFFETEFYDKTGVFIKKEIFKMDYIQKEGIYNLILDDISYGDEIRFKAFFTDQNNEEYLVAGVVDVTEFLSEEPLKKDNKAFILLVLIIFIIFRFRKSFPNKSKNF